MFARYGYKPQHGRQLSHRQELALITGANVPKSVDAIPKGITMGGRLLALEEIARNTEQVSGAKDYDSKTGLLRVEAWKERVNGRLKHRRRTDIETHVLLLDLDRFKEFNYAYGHPIGDAALGLFGVAIRNSLTRSDDTAGIAEDDYSAEDAGRFGGEEVVVALFNTDLEGAIGVAEGIKEAVSNISHAQAVTAYNQSATSHNRYLENPQNNTLSVSIGIGRIDVGSTDLNGAIYRADQALYTAKEAGRNCVRAYNSLPTPG